MSAITTTVDLSRYRVGVELSGWSADGPVTVYRVHGDGSRYPVRGMSAVSGGAAFGWDYETPLSASFTYEADDAGTVASAAVSLDSRDSTLTVPGLPSFGGVVYPVGKPSMSHDRPTVDLDILGRTTYISKSDALKAPSFTLALRTKTEADAYSLRATFAISPVLLLRIPGTIYTDWCYVRAGSLNPEPTVHYRAPVGAAADHVANWYVWTLDCLITDAPVGGTVGDPTSTWQALKDTGMTWQDLKDTGLTWLQVLKGEFTS